MNFHSCYFVKKILGTMFQGVSINYFLDIRALPSQNIKELCIVL